MRAQMASENKKGGHKGPPFELCRLWLLGQAQRHKARIASAAHQ